MKLNDPPVFTVIMDTYYRPRYLKHAVSAVRRQTYEHLEIILVNNGATPETISYLHEVAAQDARIKLIHFKENQYSPEDPLKMIFTCGNAALSAAAGDYVWYQSDDDWIADDYAEKMVCLFRDRPECTTACGRVVCVDSAGRVIDDRLGDPRPRYMHGRELAIDNLRGVRSVRAPGTVFTIRREQLISAGGFHRSLDMCHLYGIVPFGVTGYDESAIFYWRRHEGQLNVALTSAGHVGLRELIALLNEGRIEERWRVFSPDIAREVVSTLLNRHIDSAAIWFALNFLSGRWSGAKRIAFDAAEFLRFWIRIPRALWRARKTAHDRWTSGLLCRSSDVK